MANSISALGKGKELVPFSTREVDPLDVAFNCKIILYRPSKLDDSTQYVFASATGERSTVVATGSGFAYDGDGHLTGGTVTGLSIASPGGHVTRFSHFGAIDGTTFGAAAEAAGETFYNFLVGLADGKTLAKGGAGNDGFEVGSGNDTVTAGAGIDVVWKFKSGDLSYDGSAGSDTLTFQSGYGPYPNTPTQKLTVNLTTGTGANPYGGNLSLKNVENIVGTANADTIFGSKAANWVGDGRYDIGADRVRTYGGNDVILWGFGVEGALADGGAGSDTLEFVLTDYDKSKTHKLDLVDASKDLGIFKYNTARNFENLIQSNDLVPTGTRVDFIGNDLSNKVEFYSAGNVQLAGGNDVLYQHDSAHQTADGGVGTDHLFIEDLKFGGTNILDLQTQRLSTDAFAGSVYKNFEVFHADVDFAWTFRGNNGVQTFIGAGGDETAIGRGGDDVLRGNSGNDWLDGGGGRDKLSGGAWADILIGGGGNDVIDGGTEKPATWRDDDIAIYSGKTANYHASFAKGTVTIRDMRNGSPDGTDAVTNVESFKFADKTLSLADLIGQGPSIKGGASQVYSVKEGTTKVADIQSTDTLGDKEGHGLSYSIIPSIYAHGTEDGFDFTIDPKTGKLAFKVGPDFEKPADENHDNIYHVIVRVTDGHGINDSQDITVKVTNVTALATDLHVAPAAVDKIGHYDMMI